MKEEGRRNGEEEEDERAVESEKLGTLVRLCPFVFYRTNGLNKI